MREYVDADGEVHEVPDVVHEKLDDTPVAIPLRIQRADNLNEIVRQIIRSEELRNLAEASGEETFDEADDFEVDDGEDWSSPYEEIFEGDVLKDNYEQLRQMVDGGVLKPEAAPASTAPSAAPAASTGPGDGST